MGKTAKNVLATALKEVGVKESPAGSCNVKYNTAYYGGAVNNPDLAWCVVFLWWVFRESNAASLFYGGGKTANCDTLWRYYKGKGQIVTTPKAGDIVFYDFNSNGSPDHVGIVYSVNSNGSIVTIEGNTSANNQTNGGCVEKKTRAKSLIFALARPAYTGTSSSTTSSSTSATSAKTTFIKAVQTACGAKVDGIAGSETLSKTVTLSATKNRTHAAVKAVQTYLNYLGYDCGTVDGIAGSKFTAAVKKYQAAKGCVADGEITAREKTWKKLLGLA